MLATLGVAAIVSLAAPSLLGGNDASPEAAPASLLRAAEAPLEARQDGLYIDAPARLPLVTVEHIVDGDTLDVLAGESRQRVRVFGLAAPEHDEPCGPEATEQLRLFAGQEVRLLADERLEDRYGRELRYLFTPAGRSIDAALISEGAARAWRDDGAYRDSFVDLEGQAREARRGCLWWGR